MSKNNNTVVKTSGGIGFVGLLTILFIGLKLTGVIDWSWIWVLAPLWIAPVLVIGIVVIFFLIGIIVGLFNENKKRKEKF